jgi:hypothetical protein
MNDEKAQFVLIGFVCAALFTGISSSKIGSGDYYYFIFAYYSALVGLKGFELLRAEIRNTHSHAFVTTVLGVLVLGWVANAVAVILVLFGVKGVLSVREQHDLYMTTSECAMQLPKPVFIDDSYLSLPWMNPGKENFMVSWAYPVERRRGIEFERGGIGGLISEQYFGSLVAS